MLISIANIQSLFSKNKSRLISNKSQVCLVGWQDFSGDSTQISERFLYLVSSPEDFKKTSLPSNSSFLCLTDNIDCNILSIPEDDSINLLLLETTDIAGVKSSLNSYFEMWCEVGLFSDSLIEIMSTEGGIQALIDCAFKTFGNPIFVFDTGYNLLCANWEEAKKTEIGSSIIQTGGFTSKEFDLVNHLEHIHEKVKKSEVPIIIRHPEFGIDQMLCAISTKKDLGHIVVNATNKSFTQTDIELMIRLKRAIEQQLKKEEFIQTSKGFPYEYFLRDLLDGKVASKDLAKDKFDFVMVEFSDSLYCLVIETARSSRTLNKVHIRSEFEQAFPGAKSLIYNDEIVVIVSLPSGKELNTDDYSVIQNICKKHEMYAGISNRFNHITELPDYYMQSLRAIELGTAKNNTPNLFIYSDYYIQHITTLFTLKESANTYCHPKLKILLDYDTRHETVLAETLYMYLKYERNVTVASEKMFIHRNTMNYRMKKISSLIGLDFDDYDERMYIILSYELINR